jgi:hypothetical protein
MSRVHEAWRRSQMSGHSTGDSTGASRPIDVTPADGPPSVDAAGSDVAQPATTLFPIRESSDLTDAAAVTDAPDDGRSAIVPDAQSRRNQTFEELVRAIAHDEERMNLTRRASSLLSRS